METVLSYARKKRAIYFIGFLFALSSAIPTYIFSEFLSGFVGKSVGVIYSISAIISILFFAKLSFILKRFGNYRTSLFSVGIIAFSLLVLSLYSNVSSVFMFIIIYLAGMVAGFSFDIFLERESTDEKTGAIRGNFLSAVNTAWIFAPLIAGFIMGENNYKDVFTLSAIILLPVLFLIFANFYNFKDINYNHISINRILLLMPKHENTTKIFLSNFLLQFFFAWMVVYMPIYLKQEIGFSWSEIGIIFTIMLIPFVLLEAPLGRLADKKYGEKEMLSVGFIIMALSTMALSFITTKDIVMWTILLFMTRIGASMVEVMNETYFFKKNSDKTPDLIGMFRLTRPFAYLLAPVLATGILLILGYKELFLILGVLMLYGLRYSLTIKDTK